MFKINCLCYNSDKGPWCLKFHDTVTGEIGRSVGKVPAEKAEVTCKEKLGTVACVCNPNVGKRETRVSRVCQPASQFSELVSSGLSKRSRLI